MCSGHACGSVVFMLHHTVHNFLTSKQLQSRHVSVLHCKAVTSPPPESLTRTFFSSHACSVSPHCMQKFVKCLTDRLLLCCCAAVTVVDSGAQALDLLSRSAPGTFQLILTVSLVSIILAVAAATDKHVTRLLTAQHSTIARFTVSTQPQLGSVWPLQAAVPDSHVYVGSTLVISSLWQQLASLWPLIPVPCKVLKQRVFLEQHTQRATLLCCAAIWHVLTCLVCPAGPHDA
jgi:hypothetical protein